MKVKFAENHVVSSRGITESSGAKIHASAHAFKILSSGLYADKISAMLREIACNATDAHIAAGTPDIPFEVKLPNAIDSQFYIRDYGPGLSHDDVMNLYMTYFMSTKQDSNDQTGAFGLGSKSPWSYTDSFFVTSTQNGQKRTYSAHLNNKGVPEVSLLATEKADDDWPHGLMVGCPVKPGDYAYFQQKARSIYRWFRVPPKVLGAQRIPPVEVQASGPDFFRVGDERGQYVLMGNVAYPLVIHQLNGSSTHVSMLAHVPGLVLKVDIGDVQVTASREELQYDMDSVKYLQKRLDSVAKHLAKEAADVLHTVMTGTWEQRCGAEGLITKWASGFRWGDMFNAMGMSKEAALAVQLYDRYTELPVSTAMMSSRTRILRPASNNKVYHHIVTHTKGRASIARVSETCILYGRASYFVERARGLCNAGMKQVILITPADKAHDIKLSKSAAEQLGRELGLADVRDVASLPAPQIARIKRGKSAKAAHNVPLGAHPVTYVRPDASDAVIHISSVPPAGSTFMCVAPYGNYRVFNTTMDKDITMDRNTWMNLWTTRVALAREIGHAPPHGYVALKADEIRALNLVKRGWITTYESILIWLRDPQTRADIAEVASKWRPSVETYKFNSWVSVLAEWRDQLGTQYPRHVGAAIHSLNVVKTNKSGTRTPKVLDLYNSLNGRFRLPPITAVGKRTYLDIDELELQLRGEFPEMNNISPQNFRNTMSNNPGKVGTLLTHIFS